MNREFASHFKFLQAAPAKLITATAVTGDTIDLQGFDGATIAVNIGDAASMVAASYLTLRLQHTDASALGAGPSDFAYVTSADLIRFASQVGAMTSGIWYSVDSTAYSGTTQYVAYKGAKRYIRLTEEVVGGGFSGASTGCVTAAFALLGKKDTWPIASPTAVE
jgi:hypothetical protein